MTALTTRLHSGPARSRLVHAHQGDGGSVARAGLYALVLFILGRPQELFMLPPGVVLALGTLTVALALMTSSSTRNPLWAQREVRMVFALSALAVLLMPFSAWPG